jgi:malate dehydrogenase (oxaloacetate-decarboxylating)
MLTEKELLARAHKPEEDAMKLHPFYRGKIQTVPKCYIRNFEDFAVWYTPGVAKPCQAIGRDKSRVYELTNKWNTIAIVSDGTRVLGLGDIGPEAALPVMEGKSLLFKYLGGVDAVPICLNVKTPEEIITAVKWIQPSFGGINLEDIAHPKCFTILDTLRREAEIPVWHDDQQGTATVMLAGLLNALKIVNKRIDEITVSLIGAGAAGIAVSRLLFACGVKPGNVIAVNSRGILHPSREDIKQRQAQFSEQWHLCQITNQEHRTGGTAEAMKGTDVCIAISKSGPDTIKKEWVRSMADDAIIFICANPIPEIWPWEAKEAGARIIATGRSDFPNQLNNALGFPGIFRGVLDVQAKTITDEMCIAAAHELARCAEEEGLSDEHIVPTIGEWKVFAREAVAVGMKAQEQGVSRIKLSADELYIQAEAMIKNSREIVSTLRKEGLIALPPE